MWITLNYTFVQHDPTPDEVMNAVRAAVQEGHSVAFIAMRPEQRTIFIQTLREAGKVGDGPIRQFAGATLIEKERL